MRCRSERVGLVSLRTVGGDAVGIGAVDLGVVGIGVDRGLAVDLLRRDAVRAVVVGQWDQRRNGSGHERFLSSDAAHATTHGPRAGGG